jgi:hypothetical protein
LGHPWCQLRASPFERWWWVTLSKFFKPSMYRAVMGGAFDRLAAPARQLHSLKGRHELHGEVEVVAPRTFAAKWRGFFWGAPKLACGAIRFEWLAEPETETWIRFFPGKTMGSFLTKVGHRVTERLGASRRMFELLEVEGALEMRLEMLHFLGIRCPQ